MFTALLVSLNWFPDGILLSRCLSLSACQCFDSSTDIPIVDTDRKSIWRFYYCRLIEKQRYKYSWSASHYTASTGWSKSHAAHIKIFIDGCNSIQLDWINKHTVSLWQYKSPRRPRYFSKCKDVFFTSAMSVHCGTLPGISFLLNLPEWVQEYISRFSCAKQVDSMSSDESFPWQELFNGLLQAWGKEWMHASLNAVDISKHLI
jgi:hypothetical protein